MTSHRPTRRRVLGLAASTALASIAGCSDLRSSDAESIDGGALRVLGESDGPEVHRWLPVDVEESFVGDQTEVARDLLADVPAPFDADEIPNGVIRQRLNRFHEDAWDHLGAAHTAATPVERLDEAGSARDGARETRATWRAVDEGLTVADVLDDADTVHADATDLGDRFAHVGDDPVRAVVVAAEIEGRIVGAMNWSEFGPRGPDGSDDSPFDVGDVAADLERARVDVAVGSYLFDRFRESLDAERDLRPTFESARSTLLDRLTEKRESLPDERDVSPSTLVDRDVGETVGTNALRELYGDVWYDLKRLLDSDATEPSLARDLSEAHEVLTRFLAFEHLRERIADGDDVAVESADDVEALRTDAVDALEAASADDSVLTRASLPEVTWGIQQADSQLEYLRGDVSADSLAYDVSGYVQAAEIYRALPDASAEVESVLRGN